MCIEPFVRAMKHIRSGKEAKDIGMTPSGKRILITKIVADTHECLAKRNSFERSFIYSDRHIIAN